MNLLTFVLHVTLYIQSRGYKDLNAKYILQWTASYIDVGELKECPFQNCFFTHNRHFFSDIRQFDAINFFGPYIVHFGRSQLPKVRSIHQKYIFNNLESADNQPICTDMYNRFFNWTYTYKLSSTIPSAYFVIKDRNGTIVGPSPDLVWIQNMKDVDDEKLTIRLSSKTKAVAWFVSNCRTRSRREVYVASLTEALKTHGLTLDVFGECGSKSCPRSQHDTTCREMLQRDYFFYLAFENSFDEDYVTEKLLTAMKNEIVPIVYGGANYSRFLPPFSYLDARLHTPAQLAARMDLIIRSPNLYLQFFRWRRYYSYSDGLDLSKCRLCTALNANSMTYASYVKIREWWNYNYRERCAEP